jgi:hypothetical protein
MFAYFQAGAGNEEYGSVTGMDKDVVSLGRNLPPIQFCPWCGKKVDFS